MKDANGNIVKEAITNSSGEYTFEKVNIASLNQYHIEFEYNGMCYESIELKLDNNNGNKASDSGRDEFDANFEKVENNKVYKGMTGKDVLYEFKDYSSTLQYGIKGNNVLYGYEGAKYPITGKDSDINNLNELFRMTAKTGLITSLKNNGMQMTTDNIIKNGIETITGINFGIVERAQPDFALTQDIDKVEASFNGSNHTFIYGKRDESKLVEGKEKFEGEYAKQTYTRAVFPSDIEHESNSLNLAVVYKIGIVNQSKVTSKVNELKLYYDSGYEIGIEQINATKTYGDNNNNIENIVVENGIATIKLKDTMKIEGEHTEYIYVILNVKNETLDKLLIKDVENSTTLNVYAEIASYSTFNGDKYRAGIDTDSNPNSVNINDIKTFEDDTDKAPGFNLILQENRSVTGIVFEDVTSEGINSGEERKGNGKYDNGEKGIGGITVKLIDTEGNVAKRYDLVEEDKSKKWKDAVTTTNADGTYIIDGILPGEYQIEYTWGNSEYTVENYKNTIVDEVKWNNKLNNEYWYRSSVDNERNSDALDNWEKREEIDAANATMKNATIEKAKLGETKMISTTPKFKISYEYREENDGETFYGDEEYDIKTGEYKEGWTVVVKKDSLSNHIRNIDFGIVRRAKQDLKLNKRVKHLTLTLTNGTLLTDAEIIENADGTYGLKENVKDTTYISQSEAANGMLKIETTNEISQSAQIQVDYEFEIENISEIDYTTKEYYYYGKIPTDKASKIVKLKPVSIIDYMDNADVSLQSENWKLLENADVSTLVSQGYVSETIKDNVQKVSKIMKIENIMDQNSYLTPKGIQGNNSKVLEMVVSKLIAPNEDFEIGNQAEIIETTKTGGAIITSTHGNYDPIEETPEENDNSQAEDITILPPTGANKDYIIPITIGISAMLILGIGIIIIKKKVIK